MKDKECLNCGKKGHFYRFCLEPAQPGRDDRVATMCKRFEAKKSAIEGNHVYELASLTEDADEEDFATSAISENE